MEYNKYDINDILRYAKLLENKTLNIIGINNTYSTKDKGHFNKLVEQEYFKIPNNNIQEPDFKEVGVELKVTPLKFNKKDNRLTIKERTVLTKIDYNTISQETWDNCSLKKKAFKILFCFYIYEIDKNCMDYIIPLVGIWSPSNEDMEIIKQDWLIIQQKVCQGKAHEISEKDTLYLSACTKGSNNLQLTTQPYSDIKAKPRAFAFKRSYMESIYNQLKYFSNLQDKYIVKNGQTLITSIDNIFKQYYSKTIKELCEILDIQSNAKQLYSMITNKILNVDDVQQIEEFKKAGIIVKSIRVDTNNKPIESISFPNFVINDLINETVWEESQLYNILEKKFLFIIYTISTDTVSEFKKLPKEKQQEFLTFSSFKLWSISDYHLGKMEELWNETKKILLTNIQVTKTPKGYSNNLPKSNFNGVGHVRPHGRNAKDIDYLPNGTPITKQCFWLNNTFIRDELF